MTARRVMMAPCKITRARVLHTQRYGEALVAGALKQGMMQVPTGRVRLV